MMRFCSGILPMVVAVKDSGVENIIVPKANGDEASIVKEINVSGFNSLNEVV